MTKKNFTLFILMLAGIILCQAQTVSQDDARRKAVAFMEQMGMPNAQGARRAHAATIEETQAAPYYVFNATDNKGFVIVAGDERAGDILGYSTESTFDEKSLPEAAKAWLKGYEEQMEILKLNEGATPAQVPTHKRVQKLITSVWDQGDTTPEGNAFNSQCPTSGGNHCMSGCVATAMAQVMRYNKWPTNYTTEIPAYKANDILGTVDKLARTKFDWNNMLDKYDEGQSKASCDAVAKLMRYCGQSIEMDYGIDGSGTQTCKVAKALRTYFGYDINSRYVYRSDYTIEGWDNLIYNELSAGRPVVYDGRNDGGGHSFVCDGYDGTGYYHINWGWGGHHNGYFKLAILNPSGGGTGSSTANCGYSLEQGAVIGIQPPTNSKVEMRSLSLEEFYREDHKIFAKYSNMTGLSGEFDYGFLIEDVSMSNEGYIPAVLTETFDPFIMRGLSFDLDALELDNGTYRFYPYSKLVGSDWYHVPLDYQKYYEVVYSGKKVSKITNHPRGNLTIQKFTCMGNRIVNMPQEVYVKVSNSAEEYTGMFYLFASQTDEKGTYLDRVGLPVEATDGISESSLYFTPNAVGKWKVWIDIDEKGSNNLKPIEIEVKAPPTGKANLSLTSCNVIAAEDVVIKAKVKNNASEGYYSPIICWIFEEGKNYNVSLDMKEDINIPAKGTADIQFRIEGLTKGKEYYLRMQNSSSHLSDDRVWLGNRYYFTVGTDPDAIETATVENLEAPTDIYSLSGVLVRKGATTLNGLPKGIYLINGKKHMVR